MIFLKRNVVDFSYFILRKLGGKEFSNRKNSLSILLKCLIIQKVFRINHHVPWPVHWTTQVKCPEKIKKPIGCHGLGISTYLDARNGIILGENVILGPRVSIISQNHNLDDYNKYKEGPSIKIGNNCWLATNSTILPGVELGNHVIVAAGAVVTKSFKQDNILIGGVPAKIIKNLGDYEKGPHKNNN